MDFFEAIHLVLRNYGSLIPVTKVNKVNLKNRDPLILVRKMILSHLDKLDASFSKHCATTNNA